MVWKQNGLVVLKKVLSASENVRVCCNIQRLLSTDPLMHVRNQCHVLLNFHLLPFVDYVLFLVCSPSSFSLRRVRLQLSNLDILPESGCPPTWLNIARRFDKIASRAERQSAIRPCYRVSSWNCDRGIRELFGSFQLQNDTSPSLSRIQSVARYKALIRRPKGQ